LAEQLGNWNSDLFLDCLVEFYRLSLIQAYERGNDGTYQAVLHSLVRDWIILCSTKEHSWEYKYLVIEILLESLNPSHPQAIATEANVLTKSLLDDLCIRGLQEGSRESIAVGATEQNMKINEILELQKSLAALVEDTGHYEASEKLNRRVFRVSEKIHGPNHPETLRAKIKFADALRLVGKFTEAASILVKTMDQLSRLEGCETPIYRFARKSYALNLSNLERYEEAQQQFEQIIAIESRIFEPNSRIMVQNTLRLANTFRERKQYQKAISLYEAVLKTSIEKFPDNDLLKFRCMMQLANCYFDLKNWTAAAAAFKFFCSGFAMNLGKSHPSALGALGGLATLVGNPGQLENAEMLSRIAAEGMTSTAGKDSPSAIHERKNLANVLWKRGKLEESEHQFSIALESFKRSDPHYRAEKD